MSCPHYPNNRPKLQRGCRLCVDPCTKADDEARRARMRANPAPIPMSCFLHGEFIADYCPACCKVDQEKQTELGEARADAKWLRSGIEGLLRDYATEAAEYAAVEDLSRDLRILLEGPRSTTDKAEKT